MQDKEHFIRETFPASLAGLQEDVQPLWGKMSTRHIIEHLTGSVRLSNGVFNVQVSTAAEELPKYRSFLLGENIFRPNTKNAILPETPAPLRDASLAISISKLQQAIDLFFEYFAAQPDATPNHPVFGPLTYAEWQVFHWKHLRHHAMQLGVLPLIDHPLFADIKPHP